MARRGFKDGDLVHVTSRHGSLILPAQGSTQIAPAQAFVAMHWGEEFVSGQTGAGQPAGGVNVLTGSACCPVSKQPELKHAAVNVQAVELPWSLLARVWLPPERVLAARQQLAQTVADLLATMRIAGGSVIAPHSPRSRRALQPQLRLEAEEPEQQRQEFAQLSRRLLPGFALVARDDLLQTHQHTLSQRQSEGQPATALDAWLDLSRINTRAVRVPVTPAQGGEAQTERTERIEWQRDARPGWLVPIPVGYAALSELHAAGSVTQARDATTPLRFVESVFSIGQWISPHRLRNAAQLIWWPTYDEASGLYRCRNACAPETFKGSASALTAEPAPATVLDTVSA